jgi:hypothetical protein
MCNIICLRPGVLPKKKEFETMVYNNWHGYGLILKVDNKLEVIKDVPEENDPEEIWKLLTDNLEAERFLHVRHATAGDIDMDNAHPFPVISTKKTDIWFMHNDTLPEYEPKSIMAIPANDPRKAWSDSRLFVEEFLTPLFAEMRGEPDLTSPMFRKIMQKFWPLNGNRGLLISNRQEPAYLGSWCTKEGQDGFKFPSANDQYFYEVSRGPEKTRIEIKKAEAKRLADAEAAKTGATVNSKVVPFAKGKSRILRNDHFTKASGMTQAWSDIANDPALYDPENLLALSNATASEMEGLMQKLGDDVVYFILYLTNAVRDNIEENQRLTTKLDAASKLIARHKKFYPDLPLKLQGLDENEFYDLPGKFTPEEKEERASVSDQLVENYIEQKFPSSDVQFVGESFPSAEVVLNGTVG